MGSLRHIKTETFPAPKVVILSLCPVCGKRIYVPDRACPLCGFTLGEFVLETPKNLDPGNDKDVWMLKPYRKVTRFAGAVSIFYESEALQYYCLRCNNFSSYCFDIEDLPNIVGCSDPNCDMYIEVDILASLLREDISGHARRVREMHLSKLMRHRRLT